jgi:cysteine desulfurase
LKDNFVYLDNSATTKVTPSVVQAVSVSMQEQYFNPSALYSPAVMVKKKMEVCRDLIRTRTGLCNIVFTSGGTEANNLAVFGIPKGGKAKRVLYSMAEHPSIVEACKAKESGLEPHALPLTNQGIVDLEQAALLMDENVALICVMEVSNEVGTIQPVQELLRLRNERCPNARFHVDGVQGFLRQSQNNYKDMDSYSLSGHKIHGPKGIGALAFNHKHLHSILYGGGQEAGIRSGTENTAGIVGLHAAIDTYPVNHIMREIKLLFWRLIQSTISEVVVNGFPPESSASCDHIINLSFPGVKAQTLMHSLEGKGVYVSHGAACSSRAVRKNATLTAMGLPSNLIESAIRISFSPFTTQEQVEYAVEAFYSSWKMLRKYKRK